MSTPAYNLDYPEKHKIIDLSSSISATEVCSDCTKTIIAIKGNNSDFDENIAKAFFSLAPIYHVDPMRAISQSILETGWFKFAGSSVKAKQHNYCGLGAVGGGASGASFTTIENGVRAQLQHLYAYGCKDSLPEGETSIIDPRFKYVTRGIAPYWEQLAGRWAVPGFTGPDAETALKNGNTYGQKIDKIYKQLKATKITNTDIKKYFKIEDNSDIKSDPVRPDNSDLDTEKTNFIVKLFKKLFNFILKTIFKRNSQ